MPMISSGISGGSGNIPMRPDVVRELEVIDPEREHLPSVRRVSVNGEPMISMSIGSLALSRPVVQGRKSGQARCGRTAFGCGPQPDD